MSDMKPMSFGKSPEQKPKEFHPLWHAYSALQNTIAASGTGIKVSQEECEEFITRELGETTYDNVMSQIGLLSRKLISEVREKEKSGSRMRVFEVHYGDERHPSRARIEAATMLDVLQTFEMDGKDIIKIERLALGYTVEH